MVLTQLRKATEYRVILRAFNNAGDGVSVEAVAKTGEDGRSMKPHPVTDYKLPHSSPVPIDSTASSPKGRVVDTH